MLPFAAAFTLADALHKPAQAALFSVYARNPTELVAASTLWSMFDSAGFLVGSLLVGLLVALVGLGVAFAASVLPLVAATVVASTLHADPPLPPVVAVGARVELLEGARAVARERDLRLFVGIYAADMLVQAMVDVLIVVAAIGLLALGPQGAGWLSAAWGVGGVLAGVVLALLFARVRLVYALGAGLAVAGAPLTLIGLWPQAPLALGALTAAGFGFGMVEMALLTLTQRLVPGDVLARVYGAQETFGVRAMAVGSVTASVLVGLVGIRGALIATGVAPPLLAIILRRRLTALVPAAPAPQDVVRRLRALSIFAPLPMATVETLAARARRQAIDTGTEIIREGDPGNTFYVIEDGRFDVESDGAWRSSLAEGSYFGEIALMRDLPRIATVRARSPASVLVIDRADFLATVGAHPRSRHTIQQVVDARLVPSPPS